MLSDVSVPLAATGAAGSFPVIALAVIAGLWLGSLWLSPFTACSACKGSPKMYGSMATKSFHMCRRCGGTGRRKRFLAGIWPKNR